MNALKRRFTDHRAFIMSSLPLQVTLPCLESIKINFTKPLTSASEHSMMLVAQSLMLAALLQYIHFCAASEMPTGIY